jgi:hypothetical protein
MCYHASEQFRDKKCFVKNCRSGVIDGITDKTSGGGIYWCPEHEQNIISALLLKDGDDVEDALDKVYNL